MRRVIRGPAPKSLDGPTSAGGKELTKARAHFGGGVAKEVEFKAYKGDDVRAALDRDFRRKCAYCESNIGATQPMDVEHYRPKSGVADDGKLVKPGYWWLAADWTNLFPSCIDCNRERAQDLVGELDRKTMGKANQFPLAAGSPRATQEGGHTAEKPLLLDPCVDDPTVHLEFMEDGNVRPSEIAGVESERGKATIKVVALQRRGLADRRKAVALAVGVAITNVEDTVRDLAENEMLGLAPQTLVGRRLALTERLRARLRDLEAHAAPDAEYTAMAEEVIRAFKSRLGL